MNRRLCIHSLYKSITYRGQTVFWLRELDTNAGCPTGHQAGSILDLILILLLINLLKQRPIPLANQGGQKFDLSVPPPHATDTNLVPITSSESIFYPLTIKSKHNGCDFAP